MLVSDGADLQGQRHLVLVLVLLLRLIGYSASGVATGQQAPCYYHAKPPEVGLVSQVDFLFSAFKFNSIQSYCTP